jgi:hypothetical protein
MRLQTGRSIQYAQSLGRSADPRRTVETRILEGLESNGYGKVGVVDEDPL